MASKVSLKLRLGVLAPGSNFVPFLASDMLAALELGLEESRLNAELVIESTGYNADVKIVTPAIQQLILAQRVNCIIAPFNVSLIEKISGHCESQNIPLIALNLTEDPLFETARNPYIFVNSFHLWHMAWMSGYEAAQRFGPRGSAMVAMHEGGYGLLFAFQLGIEAAQGNLVQATVTHRNSSTEDPGPDIAMIAANEPDFIWAAYSGKEAASFLQAYEAGGLKNKIPLITIPTMVSSNIRKAATQALVGTWYVTAENYDEEAHNQIDGLAKKIGRAPNPYALLAYESGWLIKAAIDNLRPAEDFAENFPEALRQAEVKSQRGAVRLNQNSESKTFYLRQITDDGETTEEIIAPAMLNEQYQLACRKLQKEGWINPYLCA